MTDVTRGDLEKRGRKSGVELPKRQRESGDGICQIGKDEGATAGTRLGRWIERTSWTACGAQTARPVKIRQIERDNISPISNSMALSCLFGPQSDLNSIFLLRLEYPFHSI